MYDKEKLKRLTFDVPIEYHRELKKMGAIHNKTMRELILKLLDRLIKKNNPLWRK